MGSASDQYSEAVTLEFNMVAAIHKDRHKESNHYTNLQCNDCREWWVMINLNKKKVYCPWCGNKTKVKHL